MAPGGKSVRAVVEELGYVTVGGTASSLDGVLVTGGEGDRGDG